MERRLLLIILMASLTVVSCGYPQTETESAQVQMDSEIENTDDAEKDSVFNDTGTAASDDGGTCLLAEQPDWSKGPYYLNSMWEWLQGTYWEEGFYNRSGERVDMVCQDGTKLVFLDTTGSTDGSGLELIMINHHFNESGFQKNYLKDRYSTEKDEYFSQTAVRLLEEDELQDMNQTDLSIARNEMYARHGRIYTDPFLNAVFSRKSWYHPVYDGAQFAEKEAGLFNQYEKENLKTMIQVEQERGFRVRAGENYKKPLGILDGTKLDLDGDGQREHIYFDIIYGGPDHPDGYDVMINAKEKDECHVSDRMYSIEPFIYTASLDGKTTLLFMCGEMEDGIPRTDIYAYRDEKLVLAERLEAGEPEFMDDCFYVYKTPFEGRTRYIYRDGRIMEAEQ